MVAGATALGVVIPEKCKGLFQAVLGFFCLALVLGLTGCMKTTETVTYVGPKGETVKVVVTEGPVEGLAASGHKHLAVKAISELSKLVSRVDIPRGYDKSGKPLEPAQAYFVDSRMYDALTKMVDMSGYESPTIKGIKEGAKVAKKLAWPFFFWLNTDTASKNAGTHTNTYRDSFNGNKQSPVSMNNGHASSQSMTATSTEDSSEDRSDNSTHSAEQ